MVPQARLPMIICALTFARRRRLACKRSGRLETRRGCEKDFAANGWKVKANDSEVTQGEVGNGFSAGTAVGARKNWGCCAADGVTESIVVEHRVSLVHWNGLIKGGVLFGNRLNNNANTRLFASKTDLR